MKTLKKKRGENHRKKENLCNLFIKSVISQLLCTLDQ